MVQLLAFSIVSLLALPGIHASCSGDNCLRALQAPAVLSSAIAFCSSFTGAPGFQGTIPTYASACSVTRIKSACACLPTTSVTPTTSRASSTSSTSSTSSPTSTPTSLTCPAAPTVTVTQPTTVTLTQAAVTSDITIDVTLPASTVTSDITLPPSTTTVTVTTTATPTCFPACGGGLVNGGWESDAFGPWFFTPAFRLFLLTTPTTADTITIRGATPPQIEPFEGNWMLSNPNMIGISQTFTACRGTGVVFMSIELTRLNPVNCPVVISLWDEQTGGSLGPDITAIPATTPSGTWQNFQSDWILTPMYDYPANYTLSVEINCGSLDSGSYQLYLDAASVSFL